MTENELQKFIVKNVRSDIHQMIEAYLMEMESSDYGSGPKNVLLILGAIQAVTQDLYVQGLGDKETAMLFYTIGDRLVDKISDDKADRQLAALIHSKKRNNKNG